MMALLQPTRPQTAPGQEARERARLNARSNVFLSVPTAPLVTSSAAAAAAAAAASRSAAAGSAYDFVRLMTPLTQRRVRLQNAAVGEDAQLVRADAAVARAAALSDMEARANAQREMREALEAQLSKTKADTAQQRVREAEAARRQRAEIRRQDELVRAATRRAAEEKRRLHQRAASEALADKHAAREQARAAAEAERLQFEESLAHTVAHMTAAERAAYEHRVSLAQSSIADVVAKRKFAAAQLERERQEYAQTSAALAAKQAAEDQARQLEADRRVKKAEWRASVHCASKDREARSRELAAREERLAAEAQRVAAAQAQTYVNAAAVRRQAFQTQLRSQVNERRAQSAQRTAAARAEDDVRIAADRRLALTAARLEEARRKAAADTYVTALRQQIVEQAARAVAAC